MFLPTPSPSQWKAHKTSLMTIEKPMEKHASSALVIITVVLFRSGERWTWVCHKWGMCPGLLMQNMMITHWNRAYSFFRQTHIYQIYQICTYQAHLQVHVGLLHWSQSFIFYVSFLLFSIDHFFCSFLARVRDPDFSLLGGWALPLWKIWLRQLRWWIPNMMESHSKFHGSSHHQPGMDYYRGCWTIIDFLL